MFKSFLEGKRVALVGPASQTEIMGIGKLIDSYDVVARVGQYNRLVPNEVGSRTDIIMENFWFWDNNYKVDKEGLLAEWLSQGTQWFDHVWPDNVGLNVFLPMVLGKAKVATQKIEHINAIRKITGSPTKGMCSIYDLLTYHITELFVVGFSFHKAFSFRKDYYTNPFHMPTFGSEYQDPNESSHELSKWNVKVQGYDHDVREELNWFKGIKDNRLKCDEWLERLCV